MVSCRQTHCSVKQQNSTYVSVCIPVISNKYCSYDKTAWHPSVQFLLSSFIVILEGLKLILSIWFWVLQTALIFKYMTGGMGCVACLEMHAHTERETSHTDDKQCVRVDCVPVHMASYLFEIWTRMHTLPIRLCPKMLSSVIFCLIDAYIMRIAIQEEKQRWSEKLGN